jgi:hypothetical protein
MQPAGPAQRTGAQTKSEQRALKSLTAFSDERGHDLLPQNLQKMRRLLIKK